MRLDSPALVAATLSCLCAATSGAAATFTVTSTADDGAGSLRQAIVAANDAPGTDTIAFAIPGSGVHEILVSSSLPGFVETVVVDGYTQPGSSANSNPLGSNAQIRIELARSEGEVLQARENLTRLMGLWGASTKWTIPERLPDLPAADPSLEHVESAAIRQRTLI